MARMRLSVTLLCLMSSATVLACTGLSKQGQGPQILDANALAPTAVYQGAQNSDAFSAIHAVGSGRVIAGKRSSNAGNRFLLSTDEGVTWNVVGCPGSTGAHTYFFGQNSSTLMAGTGDTGGACIMRSTDSGTTWNVALGNGALETLIASADAKSVFGVVHLGAGKWLANVKSFDTPTKIIQSVDDGLTWSVASAQPRQGPSAWARQMILTTDGILLWPSCLTDAMYRSADGGSSWSSHTVPGAKLFQPLCDAGLGAYLCGELTTQGNTPIRIFRSANKGLTWQAVASVDLQQPNLTYWRDITLAGSTLFASACCIEAGNNQRNMQILVSRDLGKNWFSLGNPYVGPFGGMQAIYQMCMTDNGKVFAACQPDSTILRWPAW